MTDDYLSKNVIGLIFCEITNNILTIMSQYRGIWSDIFWYLLMLSPLQLPPLKVHKKTSVTTYMINNYQYGPIWNFTMVTGFSAVQPKPNADWIMVVYLTPPHETQRYIFTAYCQWTSFRKYVTIREACKGRVIKAENRFGCRGVFMIMVCVRLPTNKYITYFETVK